MSARNSASILTPTITHNQIEVTHHAVGVANYGFSGASRARYSAGRWIKDSTPRLWDQQILVARNDRGGLDRQSGLQIFVVCAMPTVDHRDGRFKPHGSGNKLIQQFHPQVHVDEPRQPGPVQHIEYFIENWLRQRQGVGGTRLL
jgi:hypothetical protein